ncbi:uncharacterized protein LOC129779021 [Toxorhynchites rutilus septentrionalis]|uniref:uncharacterized protein LOC129779021 n=1 Tax=Toxorhynchites rutilus septentrionalis TaxID=329112 RepID=UPI002479F133|nr:uncharacterized protein LOC129779021 [Toxorhynchites rutilus septentrionalis]
MGIRHLETFIYSQVPNGHTEVNIADEIRKYFDSAAVPNPPAPIIVVDLMSLYHPLSHSDPEGLLCGGRFNKITALLESFFSKLTNLGAKLVFFYDGPVQDMKYDTWLKRQGDKYNQLIEIIDSVDKGLDLKSLIKLYGRNIPAQTNYPLRQVARKHGIFITSIAKECDQELASYASRVQALALLSNDTDFMIYKGFWRYWSSKSINFETLSTMEYNRLALVRHLGLKFNQMPLFATLAGNDVIQYDEVHHFHRRLGRHREKFYNLARFVQQHSERRTEHELWNILREVFGRASNKKLMQRFRESLNFYTLEKNHPQLNPTGDDFLDLLLKQEDTFSYQIYTGHPYNITTNFTDMRTNEFGSQYPILVVPVILRKAGIVLYHLKEQQKFSRCSLVVKLFHNTPHDFHKLSVYFPDRSVPLYILRDPTMSADLEDIKLKLFCWIASDKLDHRSFQPVPVIFRPTVLTLYYLMENRVLQLFEADLFLQVAYDVEYSTYDIDNVPYPNRLDSRAFRVVFMYQKIYKHFSSSYDLVGLNGDNFFGRCPMFDGVLFHHRYSEWSRQCGDMTESIKSWRIYETLHQND